MDIVYKSDVIQIDSDETEYKDGDQIIVQPAVDENGDRYVIVTTMLADHPVSHITTAYLRTHENSNKLADALRAANWKAIDHVLGIDDPQEVDESALEDDDVKYPNVIVALTGQDGNAMMIVSRVSSAMKTQGVSAAEVKAYRDEALSGDYDNVLQTTMRWVSVI